jgi:Uma2 family endonuclease
MSIATKRMTAAEFLALPEDPNKTRYELAHGEVIVSPSPNIDHGRVVTQLMILLGSHVDLHKIGELFSDIDTYFGPEDVRRPDLLFFATDRLHLTQGQYPLGAPTLCVEVLSPSNSGFDRVDKFNLYQASGVEFYWIIDPRVHTIEAYRLQNGAYLASGRGKDDDVVKLLPFADLEVPLKRLWRSK